jgi:hypothetical protein
MRLETRKREATDAIISVFFFFESIIVRLGVQTPCSTSCIYTCPVCNKQNMSLNHAAFSPMAPVCHLVVMCASAESMGACSRAKVPFVESGSVYA